MAILLKRRPAEADKKVGGGKSTYWKVPSKTKAKYALRIYSYEHTPAPSEFSMLMWFGNGSIPRYCKEDVEEGKPVQELGLPVRQYWGVSEGKNRRPVIGPIEKLEEQITDNRNKSTKWAVNVVLTEEDPSKLLVVNNFPEMAMRAILEDYAWDEEYEGQNLFGNTGRDFILHVDPDGGPSGYYKVTLRDREKSKVLEIDEDTVIDFHLDTHLFPGYNAPDWAVEGIVDLKDYLGKRIKFLVVDGEKFNPTEADVKSLSEDGLRLTVQTDDEDVYELEAHDIEGVVEEE